MSEKKEEIVGRLWRQLALARGLRASAKADSARAVARQRFRAWQSERLQRTHADLLAEARFARAARFFLTDLYAPAGFGELEAEVERVVPVMAKLLPAAGLETVADAIELDGLSELLDAAMLEALGSDLAALDAAAYGRAYRLVGRRPERERQIRLIEDLGHALDHLTHQPFIAGALAMMRQPARLARLGALQDFLERGFGAFREMRGIDEFLQRIVTREYRLMEALFAGDDGLLGK
jgi:hypothetical protein